MGIQGTEHRRVRRAIVFDAGQRLDDRAPLHLVIVAAHDRFLAGNIGRGQQREQHLAQVAGSRRTHIRFSRHLIRRRSGPDGLEVPARDAVVQKIHVDRAGETVPVAQHEPPVAGEPANDRHLDVPVGTDPAEGLQVLRGYRQDHPFLCFRQPDLPRSQAGVLERGRRQVHLDADLLAHLAHRGGEPARAAVGDRGI